MKQSITLLSQVQNFLENYNLFRKWMSSELFYNSQMEKKVKRVDLNCFVGQIMHNTKETIFQVIIQITSGGEYLLWGML